MNKDYLIEIKVKNNWLYQKMIQNGYDSVNQLCKKHNLSPNRIGKYMSLKMAPINSKGMWRQDFIKLSGVLKCLPEDICPPQHIKNILKKNNAKIEASIEEVAIYLTGNLDTSIPAIDHMIQEENLDVIRESLHMLTPKEERILRMRYGLFGDETEYTLEEVGNMFDISRERVRQIESKAFRKLRYIGRYAGDLEKNKMENHLKTAAASMGIHYNSYGADKKSRHYVPEWKIQELESKSKETEIENNL